MKSPNLITINQFAELCKTTPRTIRLYDKLGLLKPVKIDEWTKYRYYSPFQTRDFFRIKLLQNFHATLSEVKENLEQEKTSDFLNKRISEVKNELVEKRKELSFLRKSKAFLFGDEIKKFLKEESFGPYALFGAYVHEGRYDKLNADIKMVEDEAKRIGIKTTGRQVVFYLDPDKYKPTDTKFEITVVCKKIPKKTKIPKGFFIKKFPRTTGLTFTYRGPYEFITLIYEKLHEHDILDKFKVEEYPFDVQIYGPLNKRSPYDHLTKITFPLKK